MRFQTIGPDDFAAALAAPGPRCVLDVRSLAEYEAGHVPGSSSVPVHEMGRRTKDLPRSRVTRILVIGEPGRRSEAAANWLALMGYADVALVEGGIAAFRGQLEEGPPPPPKAWEPELRVVP